MKDVHGMSRFAGFFAWLHVRRASFLVYFTGPAGVNGQWLCGDPGRFLDVRKRPAESQVHGTGRGQHMKRLILAALLGLALAASSASANGFGPGSFSVGTNISGYWGPKPQGGQCGTPGILGPWYLY